ncbi:hypothetical protein KEM52_001951, partial [Ascosphaera acerosa]
IPFVMQCKQQIEEKFQVELYNKIAEALPAMGRPRYPPAVIRKKVQEVLRRKGGDAARAIHL